MSDKEKEEASDQIAEKIKQAEALIREAQAIADQHSLGFRFSVAYGMGGYYRGQGHPDIDNDWYDEGWTASSHNC